jgi:hypothetical protein
MKTPHRSELLARPVRTDADVLARVGEIIDAEARRLQALWLFFLDRDGLQNEVVVPIDCIPDPPDPQLVGGVCYVLSQLLCGADGDGCVVIARSRPGLAELGAMDRRWLCALQQGAAIYKPPIRMLCLATPDGVRELGPVES